MEPKSGKVTYHRLAGIRIPDYVPGILAALILFLVFPFVVQSQQSGEITTEKV